MEYAIRVKRLSFWRRFADWFVTPVMYLVSGTWNEEPQRTHCWNSMHNVPVDGLNAVGMVRFVGVGERRWYEGFVSHVPILGGWRNYAVLRPRDPKGEWHVGWKVRGKADISRIRLKGAVRVLIGPDPVVFFGVDAKTGTQRFIHDVGKGYVGKGGPYTRLPLL